MWPELSTWSSQNSTQLEKSVSAIPNVLIFSFLLRHVTCCVPAVLEYNSQAFIAGTFAEMKWQSQSCWKLGKLTEIIFLIIVRWKYKDGCVEPIGPIAESGLIKVRHRLGPDQEAQVIVDDNSARIDAQRRVWDLRLGGFSSCRVFFIFLYFIFI